MGTRVRPISSLSSATSRYNSSTRSTVQSEGENSIARSQATIRTDRVSDNCSEHWALTAVQLRAEQMRGVWCPFRKSNPDVFMMEPAKDRAGPDWAGGAFRSRDRRILVEGKVRSD